MKGKAVAYGAVSIVNGIPNGKGSALGIDLKTEAEVETSEGTGEISVEILNEPDEDPSLAREIVSVVLGKELTPRTNTTVQIKSDIPISRGLKSSSSASNAIALATLAAREVEVDDLTAINLGVDASIKAGVSITGAFDDACASFFGGIVITDNNTRSILKKEPADDLWVLIHVPSAKVPTLSIDQDRLMRMGALIEQAFNLAGRGDYWKAVTLNGLLVGAALSQSTEPAIDALAQGALASGISGTGPATVAICRDEVVDAVARSWSELEGRIIRSRTNNQRAKVIRK